MTKIEEIPVLPRSRAIDQIAGNRGPQFSAPRLSDPPSANHQYIYAAAWVARVLATSRPKRHIDISASPCFAAIASAFVPVDFYQSHGTVIPFPGLRTGTVDFDRLPFRTGSVPSLSCIDLVHRLGDSDEQAMAELKRVLAPDGSLLLVCSIGKGGSDDRSRAYTFGDILDWFEGLDLEEFALVPDAPAETGLIVNPEQTAPSRQQAGFGCFWFRKPSKQ